MSTVGTAPNQFVRTYRLPRTRLYPELSVFLFCVGLLIVSALLQPASSHFGTHTQLGLPPCGFMAVFAKPCPSCGLTTAFSHVIRAELAEATKAHPAGALAFLYVLACTAVTGFSLVTGRRVVFANDWAIKSFVLVMVLVLITGGIRLLMLS